MKTAIHLPIFYKHWFCGILSFLFTFSVAAQEKYYRNPDDLSKGHWQLFTDATTRTTNIKFFDASNHLLYEEIIPGKYIRLTNRNINRINQAFDQITSNQKVLTKVKAEPLPAIPIRPFLNRNDARRTHFKTTRNTTGSKIQINSFKILNSTKFYLAFENPDRERIKIYLKDDNGQILYSENVNSARYTRKLDTVGLHKGKYFLIVTTVNRKYRFTKLIEVGPVIPTLEVEQPDSLLVISNK